MRPPEFEPDLRPRLEVATVDRDTDKHGVVTDVDVLRLLERRQRNELGKSGGDVGVAGGTPERRAGMIRTKRLGDVLPGVDLIQQGHGHSLVERPALQRVEHAAG